jgi:hypothetical protein
LTSSGGVLADIDPAGSWLVPTIIGGPAFVSKRPCFDWDQAVIDHPRLQAKFLRCTNRPFTCLALL